MTLDIRLPLGLLFTLIGALLVVYGITHGPASIAGGLNVNLDWGTVLIVFGASMLLLAYRRTARAHQGKG